MVFRIILSALFVVALALGLSTGCVTRSNYQQQVDEAERQRQEASRLSEELQRLEGDKAQLLKDLQSSRGELSQRVADLTLESDRLTEQLKQIEAEKSAKDAEIAKLKGTYDQLVADLKQEISAGEIRITQLQDKLTVNLVEKILFDSGRAEIKPGGKKILDKVSAILKKIRDRQIVVEGHTDNVPIGKALQGRFPTNWELSTARATVVTRYLQDNGDLNPDMLAAVGYGPHRPIVTNETEEGRSQNRRIEIVLVPREIIEKKAASR